MEFYACGYNVHNQLNRRGECERTGHPDAHPSLWDKTFCKETAIQLEKVLEADTIWVLWASWHGTLVQVDDRLRFLGLFDELADARGLFTEQPQEDPFVEGGRVVQSNLPVSHILNDTDVVGGKSLLVLVLFAPEGCLRTFRLQGDGSLRLVTPPWSSREDDGNGEEGTGHSGRMITHTAQTFEGATIISTQSDVVLHFQYPRSQRWAPDQLFKWSDGDDAVEPDLREFPASICQLVAATGGNFAVLTADNHVYTWRGLLSHRKMVFPDVPLKKFVLGQCLFGPARIGAEDV